MYRLNGLKIAIDAPCEINGTTIPAGHFRDPEARAQYGIEEVPDPVWPDPLTHNAVELPSGDLEITEKSAEERAQALGEFFLQAQLQLDAVVTAYMDGQALQRGYSSIDRLCTYNTSANPKFAAEAQAGIAFRDAVWGYCDALRLQILASSDISLIPSVDQLLAALPLIEWPAV